MVSQKKNRLETKHRNFYFQLDKKDSSDKITLIVFCFIMLSTPALPVVAGDLQGKRIQVNLFLLIYFNFLRLKFTGGSFTYCFY